MREYVMKANQINYNTQVEPCKAAPVDISMGSARAVASTKRVHRSIAKPETRQLGFRIVRASELTIRPWTQEALEEQIIRSIRCQADRDGIVSAFPIINRFPLNYRLDPNDALQAASRLIERGDIQFRPLEGDWASGVEGQRLFENRLWVFGDFRLARDFPKRR